MKYVLKANRKGPSVLFRVDDAGHAWRFDRKPGKWMPLGVRIDFDSGFGESYMYEVITEEEALGFLGLEKWPDTAVEP